MRSYNDGVAETELLGDIVSAVAAQARAMMPIPSVLRRAS
jgi:hypothetical protein